MKINFSQILNPNQLDGTYNISMNSLILAGAGSGKTRVLVYKTAYLLEQNIPPEKILLITFTRKATQEIKERIHKLFPNAKISIETFHSLAYKNLNISKSNIKILHEENLFHNLSYKNRLLFFIRTPFQFYKTYKAYKIFQQYKKDNNYLGFQDLIEIFYRNLKSKKILLNYDYILVDEYQDTDIFQKDILKIISKNKNITVLGDDFQSIYKFRGAHVENIFNFSEEFSPCKTIFLNENYRSTPEILNFTNSFSKKNLFTQNPSGPLPKIFKFSTNKLEVLYILKEIKNILKNHPLTSFAILFRNFEYMREFLLISKIENLNLEINKNLFTFHGAKGLEWDYVFIPTFLQGVIPNRTYSKKDLDEELRLFYVACTRARKDLTINYPKSIYTYLGHFNAPSSFLKLIPPNLYKKEVLD
ncbi:MAG: ATP-dependent helicase [Cetobacterium sp.]|nr:ATP-dependent helicase [Cetobacterium sp.]